MTKIWGVVAGIVVVGAASCSKLTRVITFNQENAEYLSVPTVEEQDGSTSGIISKNAKAKQRVEARAGQGIYGASLVVLPGALLQDTKIVMEKSPTFASSSLAKALGAEATITNTGQAVKFSSSPKIETSIPMLITLPSPVETTLSSFFLDSSDRWVVFYETLHVNGGESYKSGIIPRSEFTIVAGRVMLKTKQFGRFQVAISSFQPAARIELPYSITEVLNRAVPPTPPVADQPTASVAPGAYLTAQSVALSTTTVGAEIRYTVDGTTPGASSDLYAGEINIATTTTLKAVALKSGYTTSQVFTAVYSINEQVSAPASNIAGGEYGPAQVVELTTVTPGAEIRYTLDGSSPGISSTLYMGALTISTTTTLKAIAVKSGMRDSAAFSAIYTINGQVATPATDVAQGAYGPAQTVSLSSATAGAEIRYTLDGSAPTQTSTLYVSAITISTSKTLKAVAFKANYITSEVLTANYTINGAVATPVMSLAGGTYHSSKSVTISTSTSGATIYYTLDGSTPTSGSSQYAGAIDVHVTQTIKALAVKSQFVNSGIGSETYTINIVTPVAVRSFPNTVNFPNVIWTPKARFSLGTADTFGLFSDTTGTSISPSVAVVAGSNEISANTVSTLGGSGSIYTKSTASSDYVSLGSYGNSLPASFEAIDGTVFAVAVDSLGKVYIGGDFKIAGSQIVNYVAKWDGTKWLALGIGFNGAVKALAVDGNDHVIAGGTFTCGAGSTSSGIYPNNTCSGTGGATVYNRVAKWDGSAWGSLDKGVNNSVNAVAVDSSGKICVGGDFTSASGVTASRVGCFVSPSWSGLGSGTNGTVHALMFEGSDLYAGGAFTSAGGVAGTSKIAKFSTSAWLHLNNGVDNTVYAIAGDGLGKIYIGGDFTLINGGAAAANRIASLNLSTGIWEALGAGASNTVTALRGDGGGNIYVGGKFNSFNGTVTNFVGKWSGTSFAALGSDKIVASTGVYALGLSGAGELFVGGDMSVVGSTQVNKIAKYQSGSWSSLGGGFTGRVNAMVKGSSGRVFVGGKFDAIGGVPAKNVAMYDGSNWHVLGTAASNGVAESGEVFALALDTNDALYVGGDFYTAGSVAVNNFAKWDGSVWVDVAGGFDSTVNTIYVKSPTEIYAGGKFSNAGGLSVNYIAAYNGTQWQAMGLGLDNEAKVIVGDGVGNIYVGGAFTYSDIYMTNHVAKWSGTSWSALGAGFDGVAVNTLGFDSSGNLYAGGEFKCQGDATAAGVYPSISCTVAGAGSTVFSNVAKWTGSSWSALGSGVDNAVRALAVVQGSEVYFGGDFTQANGAVANRIVRYASGSWSALGSGANGQIRSMIVNQNNDVLAGGSFTFTGDKLRPFISEWATKFSQWF